MKETFYFPHDCNSIQDPKMMELLSSCGLAGIGFYWILMEILHQQVDGKITLSSLRNYIKFYCTFETNVEHLLNKIEQELIKNELVLIEDDFIFSTRVLDNKKTRENLSKLRSKAGKKSAAARAKLTSVEQVLNKSQLGKERKGKEKKGNTKGNTMRISDFDTFWKNYPLKKSKATAKKKFLKLDRDLLDQILRAVEKEKNSSQWTKDDGAFIPHPSTWLNQERWEDEGLDKIEINWSSLSQEECEKLIKNNKTLRLQWKRADRERYLIFFANEQ